MSDKIIEIPHEGIPAECEQGYSALRLATLQELVRVTCAARGHLLECAENQDAGDVINTEVTLESSGQAAGVVSFTVEHEFLAMLESQHPTHTICEGVHITLFPVELVSGNTLVMVLETAVERPFGDLDLESLQESWREAASEIRGAHQVARQQQRITELEQQLAEMGRIIGLDSDENSAQQLLDSEQGADSKVVHYHGFVSRSPKMKELFEVIDRIKDTDLSVILVGETGTGKELLARALHVASTRADGPFEVLGCGSIPNSLLESELFGHKKGSFSGAESDHVGIFERASGGTLFLDEISDMSQQMQQKILRVLQENEVRPVGASKAVPINVRVVSSTRFDLNELVATERLRQDLYFRLNLFIAEIPPLRERPEDISTLIDHFMVQLSKDHNESKKVAESAMRELLQYPWPGNVQELRNLLLRVCLSTSGRMISRKAVAPLLSKDLVVSFVNDDLYQEGERLHLRIPTQQGFNEIIAECEKLIILSALKNQRGNKSRVTQQLKIPRQTLYNKIEKYGITDMDYQQ